MSEPTASFPIWKPVMVFLLISLIGTVWLYEHYDDKLKDELRARSAQLTKVEGQLADQGTQLAAMQAQGDNIHNDMEALKQGHAEEVAKLNEHLAVARKAGDNLGEQIKRQKKQHEEALAAAEARHEKEMDTLRLAHTQALKTAQVQTADVAAAKAQTEDSCAEMDRNYDAAKETVVRLETKLARLNDAIVASATEHREQVERLQRHINERIELARVTPMDAELIRTAKEAGIIVDTNPNPGATTAAVAGAAAADASAEPTDAPCKMPGVKAALDKLEAEHNAVLAQHDAALQAQADALTEQHRTEVADLKRSHADELVTLRQQLETGRQAAEAAPTEHKANTGADDAQQQLAALTTDLEQARTELDKLQAQCDSRVDGLTTELTETKSALDAAQAAETAARTETEAAEAALAKTRDEAEAALNKARDEADAELAEQRQAVEQARAAVAAAEADAEQAATACADESQALRQALDAAKAEVSTLTARVDDAGAASADVKAEADARIKALQAEVAKHQRVAEQARSEQGGDADAAVAALRDLYSRFSALGGRYTERGMLLRLANTELRFPSGAATLPAGELPSLDKIAELLADHPKLSIRIEGHTDSYGADDLNQTLSAQRAEAVEAALVERGVDAERISAAGFGSSRPIGDNATAAGRSENRRVEVYVIEPEE